MSGNDEPVRRYVMDNEKAVCFLEKLVDMVEFLIPNYVQEGKTQLVIGIGCTGGKHRSIAFAEMLAAFVKKLGYHPVVEHRDVQRTHT